jgi:hypothetical protein
VAARLLRLAGVLLACAVPVLLWDASLRAAVRRDVAALAGPEGAARDRATARLEALGADAVPALVGCFEAEQHNVASALRGSGTGVGAGELTVPVMGFLQSHVSPAVVDGVVAALGDDDRDVAHFAGLTLAWIGPAAEPAVSALLRFAPEPRVRTSAAWVLSLMGEAGTPALPALQEALQDPDEDVRLVARFAISQLSSGNEAFWEAVRAFRAGSR